MPLLSPPPRQEEEYEEDEEATGLPSDVLRGHFAVYVRERRRRFVVPIALLDRPKFRSRLRRAEEFGFAGAGVGGILVLPCAEVAFCSLTRIPPLCNFSTTAGPTAHGVGRGLPLP